MRLKGMSIDEAKAVIILYAKSNIMANTRVGVAFDTVLRELDKTENRPKGKWIALDTPKGHVQEYKCSNCGEVTEDFAYCPMCGAMMFDEESVMPELEMRGEE